MTPYLTFEQIYRALQLTRPGLTGWSRMMPQSRRMTPPTNATPRQAGVLILLYTLDERIHLVLTRRTETLSTHSGQISLPGGGVEGDETPVQAALREAYEELGPLPPIRVLGELTPLYISLSNYIIHPFVGVTETPPTFQPDPREVAEVLEVSLDALLVAENRIEEVWELRGTQVRVPFYQVGSNKIWGATAMVLAEFTMLLENLV